MATATSPVGPLSWVVEIIVFLTVCGDARIALPCIKCTSDWIVCGRRNLLLNVL